MQVVHWVNPTIITASSSGTWVDRKVSDYIGGMGSNVTGVLLYVYNASTTSSYTIGFRKNGSTDDRKGGSGIYHTWAFSGVDNDTKFEFYSDNTNIKVYIIGYVTTGAVFYDNATSVTPAITGSWQDLPALPAGAIGGIYEFRVAGASVYSKGIRPKGSTDEFYDTTAGYAHYGIFIGCDASQIVQAKISNAAMEIWERGYVTDGFNFETNGIDYSQTNTGALEDLADLPVGSDGGVFLIKNPTPTTFRLRGKDDVGFYKSSQRINSGTVRGSTSNKVESEIASDTIDYYLVGETIPGTLTSGLFGYPYAQTPTSFSRLDDNVFDGFAAISPSGDNKLVKVGAYMYGNTADSYCKAVVYKQSDLSLFAVSPAVVLPVGFANKAWVEFTFTTPITMEADTNYIIGVVSGAATNDVYINTDTISAPADCFYTKSSLTYESPQDPLDTPTISTKNLCIYGYYEVNSTPVPGSGNAFGQNAQTLLLNGFI